MKKQVLIRGVDEKVYRLAKAAAASVGLSMGAAVEQALDAWAKEVERSTLERELSENLNFVRREWENIKMRHQGEFAVVAQGKLQGAFGSYDEARKVSSRFRIALAFPVEGDAPERREIEFGPELAL